MKSISRLLASAILLLLPSPAFAADLPRATADKLPAWRGFNLLEKFNAGNAGPFKEEDFRLIRELGFNFVRLPMDYRTWIVDKDWNRIDETVLKEIDQAVEWGGRYGIHVCINFHRAPGYTVAKPPEAKSLWTDPEAQAVCAKHWALFAKRYKGIPNERLSFNLFNEPAGIESAAYAAVAGTIIAAIRAEDPDRLILSDGLQWGREPCLELIPLKVAQATRGYEPGAITHYKASWVNSGHFPHPAWPVMKAHGSIYGTWKKEFQAPLVIAGDFGAGAALRLKVGQVCTKVKLVAKADGKPVWEKEFATGPGGGEWKKSEARTPGPYYVATYEKDYTVTVPAGAREVTLEGVDGDWMTLLEIGLTPAGRPGAEEAVLAFTPSWGKKPTPVRLVTRDGAWRLETDEREDRMSLKRTMIDPWKDAQAKGVGVMVGEFGCYNKTPHDVVLRWMEDCLRNWREAGWGWALWNFRGSFGILGSERKDVKYEDWKGHKLDRKMLDLLQRY